MIKALGSQNYSEYSEEKKYSSVEGLLIFFSLALTIIIQPFHDHQFTGNWVLDAIIRFFLTITFYFMILYSIYYLLAFSGKKRRLLENSTKNERTPFVVYMIEHYSLVLVGFYLVFIPLVVFFLFGYVDLFAPSSFEENEISFIFLLIPLTILGISVWYRRIKN